MAGRSPWHSGYSDGCWCCSSGLGSTGLQAGGKKACAKTDGREVGIWAVGGQNTFIMETQGPKTPKFLPGSYLFQPGHNLRPGKRLSQVAGSGTRPSPAGTGQCLILELTGGEGCVHPISKQSDSGITSYFVSPGSGPKMASETKTLFG